MATTDAVGRIIDTRREDVEPQTRALRDLLAASSALTQQIATLTAEIHVAPAANPTTSGSGRCPVQPLMRPGSPR